MANSYLDKDGLLYFLQKIRANATPSMDGTASTGTAKRFALQDHVHPSDTSKAPLASPALTGTPTAPTATLGTSTTQIATTEFVANTVGAMTSGVSDVQIDNSSIVTTGIAKIPTASASAKGLMTSTHYSKLEGIASGAEVNVLEGVQMNGTDLAISSKKVNIPTFTGATTSAAGSVGLVPAPAKSIAATNPANKRYLAGNGSWTLLPIQSFNDTTYNNVSVLQFTDSSGQATHRAIGYGALGAASGVCPLDANSKVDASYLPSYVDDVIEAYARSGATALAADWLSETSGGSALTPETGKIYVLMADSGDYAANTQFRWGGSAYVKLADGGVSSITNAEIDTIVAS